MDRFQDGLFACVLTLYVVLVFACQSEGTRTCKDGVCTGFSQQIDIGGIKANLRSVSPFDLEAIAKVLSDQRKYGPEITAQDILDLLGEAVDEKRRRETL